MYDIVILNLDLYFFSCVVLGEKDKAFCKRQGKYKKDANGEERLLSTLAQALRGKLNMSRMRNSNKGGGFLSIINKFLRNLSRSAFLVDIFAGLIRKS